MAKKKDKRANNGGSRLGAGRPPKALEVPTDESLAANKLKYERLLLSEALPLAYTSLKKALEADSPVPLIRYTFDRVYGRPRESDKLTGADEGLRRELAISEARKRVELLDEQIQLARLQRKDKERKEGDPTKSGRDEGRFYPAGGSGVGPCGRYHATLDQLVYPSSPFARPDLFDRIKAGDQCPICGDARFIAPTDLVANPLDQASSPLEEVDEEEEELDDDDQVDR